MSLVATPTATWTPIVRKRLTAKIRHSVS
jgi:hypothetical protein